MVERLGRRLVGSVLLWDLLLTLACLYASSLLRLWVQIGKPIGAAQTHLPWQLYLAVAVIWAVVFLLVRPQHILFFGSLLDATGRLVGSVLLASLTFAGMLYLSYRDISRLQFLYFSALDLLALLTLHLAVRQHWRSRGEHRRDRHVLVVGTGPQAQQLVEAINACPWTGLHVVGFTGGRAGYAGQLPVLGPIEETPRLVVERKIDEVIFAIQDQEQITRISLQLQREPVMLHVVPGLLDLIFSRTPVANFGGVPLISLRESALSEPQWLIKRLFDITGSALLLLIFFPLMVLIALAIKLDSPGPVFFLQERIGAHGRRFRVIKFRSMYQDADRRWEEVAQRDEQGRLIHKVNGDPRVTPIGRRLRRTSLDELPQLINVLRGEMSLVGPRPEMPYVAVEYEPWQWNRFRVPPGITGWWQINGRSEKPMHLHTEDDLYYIQNYSFLLDLKILWKTLTAVIKGRGAF